MICITGNIVTNTPNVICRGTDTLTDTHIFTPDSGISSHSFGRSYMDKIRKFEKDMLEKHKQAISKTFS